MSNKIRYYVYLIVILTILPIFNVNTVIMWFLYTLIIYFSFKIKRNNYNNITSIDNSIFNIYILWLVICCFRGCIIAENYWEWKQLITGTFYLSLPIFIFSFSSPYVLQITLTKWIKYVLPIFILIGFLLINSGRYQFTLAPIYLLTCFIPFFRKKWRLIISTFIILLLISNLGARSQTLKAIISIIICICMYYYRHIPIILIKCFHLLFYILPIILLILGISGRFNVFKDLSSNEGKFSTTHVVNGEIQEEDLSADTRTLIYTEILESALKHNYIIWGRTPARGNDSALFGSYKAEVLKTGKHERHSNEVCHPTVFTWLGLIGVILYSIFYMRASYLAVYKSNNIYIKFIGLLIAFHWAYGWVEDTINFDILNITLWMIISIGMSKTFRNMSNNDFRQWALKIIQ